MNRDHVLIAYLVVAAAIAVWAFWPRRSRSVRVSSIPSFRTTVNGCSRHDFWREITLDTFTRSCRDGTFDILDIDADLTTYVIAVVTVANWIGRTEFETRFSTTLGNTIVKKWSPRNNRLFGNATAMFLLPETVIGGTTEIRCLA